MSDSISNKPPVNPNDASTNANKTSDRVISDDATTDKQATNDNADKLTHEAATEASPHPNQAASERQVIAPLRPEVPATDISLINDSSRAKKSSKTKPASPSFFMMRGYQILLVLSLIAAFALAMVYQTLFGRIEQPQKMVTIDHGQTYYGLLPQWQKQIPLFSSSIAKLYIKSQVDAPLHAGTYQLPENPSLTDALSILQQGAKVAMVKVQIIEGKRASDLYQTLRQTPGIKLEVLGKSGAEADNQTIANALGIAAELPANVKDSTDAIVNHNLEGWFTPDTYYYGEGTTDKKILLDLYQKQKQALDKAWASRDSNVPYQTPYEALVMASIIEKETSVPEERPLVAAVFANRMKKGMRLQTDPTIIYGMGSRYDGNIRRSDINEVTSYNTYQINGLPPTPIALPSAASIEATLHPAASDALYFVATGNGGHKFTNSLADHNQAVQEYLKVRRQKQAAEQP